MNNEQFSDIAFLVEGRTVHAHKFILFARCEYFRRMFTGGYKVRARRPNPNPDPDPDPNPNPDPDPHPHQESTEACVPIPDVTHDVFLCILTFLYTGKPREVPAGMAVEVMGAANLYNIEPLKRTCAEVIARDLSPQPST